MPNHCDNELRIYGPKAERDRFLVGAKAADGKIDILGAYYPVPKALEGIHYGGATIDGVQVASWRTVDDKEMRIPDEELVTLVNSCGATNSYDWCVRHWGTKWGDYSHQDPVETKSSLMFRFDSAWSPPVEGLVVVSEAFPKLRFELRYWEAGCGFKGGASIKAGEITKDWSGSYRGSRGG